MPTPDPAKLMIKAAKNGNLAAVSALLERWLRRSKNACPPLQGFISRYWIWSGQ